MNKAVSRNIKGIDFDAQAAARDAARREGKTLGEWLHGVIAEHAAGSGVSAGDVAGRERVDVVTSRLERLSAKALFSSGRGSGGAPSLSRSTERISDATFDGGSPSGSQHGWRGASQVEDPEALLEDAIEQLDRRAALSERRTEEALATVAKMIETGEARRARESEAVSELTQKLAILDTKLTQQFAPADNSVKGALARLEARLELIGKRNDADAEARAKAVAERPAFDGADTVRRLEDKLTSILGAVEGRGAAPQAVVDVSHGAPLASHQPEKTAARRSLGEAIAEISHRQKMLDDPASAGQQARGRLLQTSAHAGRVEGNVREMRRASEHRSFHHEAFEPAIAENGIADLINRVDDIRRDLAASREMRQATRAGVYDDDRTTFAATSRPEQERQSRTPTSSVDASLQDLAARLDRPIERVRTSETARFTKSDVPGDIEMRRQIGELEKDVRDIAETVDSLRSAGVDRTTADMLQAQMKELAESALALRAMITTAPGALALEKIEQRLERLAGKVDAALIQAPRSVSPPEPKLDTSVLEGLVRELGHKIEAAQAPSADTYAIESLQNQVEQLSERFARSEQGLSTLPTLAASVRELFNQLEATRASVETSAAHAAREVLRIAADEGRSRPVAAADASHGLNASKTLQKDADQRVQSTLNTVHAMLEKVVDRLTSVEHDIADVRRQPASPAPPPNPVERSVAPRPPASKVTKHPEPAKSSDLGFGGMETARDPIVPLNGKRVEAGKPVELDESARHNDFIAAARRAAKSVQAEPPFAALKRSPGPSAGAKASRADILAKSRDYVATHKRPMLMGIAAILMVLGTIAVLQRTGLGSGQEIVADDAQTRAGIARPSEARLATSGTSRASAELSPSAMPQPAAPLAEAIPGSDPVQTGSIPSLPAFAAQATASRPARQGLPSGLMIAAEAGNGEAQYDLGTRYIDGRAVPRDMKIAAQWLEKAANQGLAPAKYRLASLYEKGIGVAQDKAKARSLYTSAAEAGNPRAMHNLAVMLADGDGHPDYAGAATWFRKAASFGIHDSQYNLAILLARGLGVQQSLVQSYQWFAVAAAKNDTDAARKRDEVGTKMTSNDLAVAKALAAAFQPKTANASVLEIEPPPGGWDSAPSSSRLNSAKSKISSL